MAFLRVSRLILFENGRGGFVSKVRACDSVEDFVFLRCVIWAAKIF